MCSVSAVLDYGIQNPPWKYTFIPTTPYPTIPDAVPVQMPDREAAEAIKKFIKMVEAAKEFDVVSRQPDCEDPIKAKFMTEVLDRLAAIEKRLQSLPSNP